MAKSGTTRSLGDRGRDPDDPLSDVPDTLAGEGPLTPVASPPSFLPGTSIGRYAILEQVGSGGMGLVFAAYDPKLDRRIALKVVPSRDPSQHRRLMREALALGRLTHPNVVAVHDAGELQNAVFVAMEFIEGETLAHWMKAARGWREVLRVFIAAGEGLVAAHASGLVHRDFKPGNVMIDRDGRVRVTDFGVARPLEGTPEGQLSSSDVWSGEGSTIGGEGTPLYMAPEQHHRRPVDARSDQFSFCVSLYEAVYGTRPFVGETAVEVLRSMESGTLAAPITNAGAPAWLRLALERGLSIAPDDRFPSVRALLDELERHRGRSRPLIVAGVLVLGTVAVWLGFSLGGRSAPPPCTGFDGELSAAWGAERKAAARTAVLGLDVPHAAKSWESVEADLDRWAAGWVAAATEACEATLVRRVQSDTVLDARMRCLDRGRRRLQSVSDALLRVSTDRLDNVRTAAARLPRSDRCSDLEFVQAAATPKDPEQADAVEAVERVLDELHTEALVGDAARSVSLGKEALALADRADADWLRAEVGFTLGERYASTGDYTLAAQAFEACHFAARRARHEQFAAACARGAAYTTGHFLRRPGEGLLWASQAKVAAELAGSESELIEVEEAVAGIKFAQGDYGGALEVLEAGLARAERFLGADTLPFANWLNNLGAVYLQLGRNAEAVDAFARTLGIRKATLGETHGFVALTLRNLGTAQLEAGDDDALATLRSAIDLLEGAYAENHPALGEALVTVARAERSAGELAAAIDHLERAKAIAIATRGPDHEDALRAEAELALIEIANGNDAAAKTLLLALLPRVDPTHVEVADLRAQILNELADLDLGR